MMQKFIVLGEGYGDVFELEAIIEHNHHRIDKGIFLHADARPATFVLVMKPVRGNFQALYTIYQGVPYKEGSGKKYQMISEWCTAHDLPIIEFKTRDPEDFHDKEQFFQYITGVLRLNNLIPPLT
ncbi:DUF7147 family protein [Salinicoccus sp. CNSTN-B1]